MLNKFIKIISFLSIILAIFICENIVFISNISAKSTLNDELKFNCNVEKYCNKPSKKSKSQHPYLKSCTEAMYHYVICGEEKRDADNDGIPCENLCGKNKNLLIEKLNYEKNEKHLDEKMFSEEHSQIDNHVKSLPNK